MMDAIPKDSMASSLPGAYRPGRLRIWFQAVRFFSFTASVIPIVAGSSLALMDRSFDILLFVVMVAASVACHAGANLANDYFDHKQGIDTAESLGPSKVVQLGYLSPREVLRGTLVFFSLATVLGLYIVYRTGWPILVIALLSLAAAVLYTGGPKPLGYIALGELTVFLFMGPVMVCSAYFVHTGNLTLTSVLLSLPVGLLVAAILHANNIRDMELDHKAGKLTMANVLGRKKANAEYAALVVGAYVAVVSLVLVDMRMWPLLVVFVSVPAAAKHIRTVYSGASTVDLDSVLRKTAGLHLRAGLLLSAGLLARSVIDRMA